MTKLYLVRHGQTVDNVNQIMQGQTQGELTAEGVEQARQLRDQLCGKRFDAFVSSPADRLCGRSADRADAQHGDATTFVQQARLADRDG